MKLAIRIFSVTAIFFLISLSTINAQTVYFCEGVDDDGYPISSSSSFTISRSGGYLYVLTRLGYQCETYTVYMDFYKINSRGKEVFEETFEIETKPSWSWFWKEITFYDPGTYIVYIADGDGYPLAEGEVEISVR
jgi:hypothetical protein